MRGSGPPVPSLLHHQGILSFPLEILIRIIEFTAGDVMLVWRRSELDSLIVKLSSVCRAFRTIVLNTVMLWTKIDDRFCLRDDFPELLSRSKSAPLILDIYLTPRNWKNVLQRILPYKDRWYNLRAELHFDLKIGDVMRDFPNIEFPALKRLDILIEPLDQDYSPIFTQWTFPNVVFLAINDLVPPTQCVPSLQVLELNVVNLDTHEDVEALFGKLADFLRCRRSLQILNFDISGFIPSGPDELPVIELPNIKELKIGNSRFPDHEESPRSSNIYASSLFARSIRVPNVEVYSLSVIFDQGPGPRTLRRFVQTFGSNPEALHRVTDLFVSTRYQYTTATMLAFLSLFRDVRDLTIDVPHFGAMLVNSDGQVNLRHLESLTLRKETESFLQADPMSILKRFNASPKAYTVKLNGHDEIAWELESDSD